MMANILIDGREFVAGKRTGIGRFLEGLLLAMVELHPNWKLSVALDDEGALPHLLSGKVECISLPKWPELSWPKIAAGFDLFFSPYPKLPLRNLPCPAINTVHDVFYLTHATYQQQHLRTMLGKWVLRRSVARANLTWFVSSASQQACEALIGPVTPAKVRYSPVEACFSPSLEQEVVADSAYFLCVGNGLPHKNLEVIFKAVQGTEVHVKCVGVAVGAKYRLQQQFPELEINIEFVKGVSDDKLVELYQHATALLLPSLEEGYGFPPLEAMACGTPSIVSDIPVLRESTGGKALYCPPQESEAWMKCMQMMLDADVRQDFSQSGLSWVKSRQGVDGWAKHVSDFEVILGTN